jgi:D-erythronate 2-dehydrogenase
VAEMVDALKEVAGEEVASLIDWQPDPKIEKIVGSWPGAWETSRGEKLGLAADRNFSDVIRAFIAESRGA